MTTTTHSPLPALALTPDRTLLRYTGKSVRYLHVRITAPAAARDAVRPAVHVAFSLDRSGSMGGRKLDLAKQAVHSALGRLTAADRFTVVTFDDVVDVVTPASFATGAAVGGAHGKLQGVDARGSTALCEGWLTACGEIAPASGSPDPSAPAARCFLLTDGQANVGETRATLLAQHAHELYLRGVRTVTFGLGDGFNEDLLQGLAAAGGGHFYFIEQAINIDDYIASELGEALDVASRDVHLTLHAPGMQCEPLTAYAVERADRDQTIVRLGDLVSDQVVELVVKLTFPAGDVGTSLQVRAQLSTDGPTSPDQASGADQEIVHFSFADNRDNDRQPRERSVDRQVAEKYAANARRNAVSMNRQGDYQGAERELVGTAKHILGYAHGDATLLALAGGLVAEAKAYSAPMVEMDRKRAHMDATSSLKGRDASGRARKS